MTEPFPGSPSPKEERSASLERRSLNYQETYLCPVCRHGQIQAITLMDAFACEFCRHIFTANLPEQSVHVEDSSQPMTWRWNGFTWQAANRIDLDLAIAVWAIGAVLVFLPPALIWLSSHTFPPMRGSIWYWFPTFWSGLAFVSHFLFVAWLVAEYYQFPPYVASKVRLARVWQQR